MIIRLLTETEKCNVTSLIQSSTDAHGTVQHLFYSPPNGDGEWWWSTYPQFLAPRGASSLGAIAIGLLAEAWDAENQTFTVRCGLVSTEGVSARRPIVIAPSDTAPLGARNWGSRRPPQSSVSVRRRINAVSQFSEIYIFGARPPTPPPAATCACGGRGC